MQTDLDIVNGAIAECGGDTIDALDETTPLGAFAAATYAAKRAYCLGRYRWVFATRLVQLAEVALPALSPLPHCFARPSDIVGAFNAFRDSPDPNGRTLYVMQQAQQIFARTSPVYAEYTAQVPEAEWPATFAQFVRIAYAADIATQLDQTSKAQGLDMQAWGAPNQFPARDGGMFLAAMLDDAKNAPARNLDEQVCGGPLIGVRQVEGRLLWDRPPGFEFKDFR